MSHLSSPHVLGAERITAFDARTGPHAINTSIEDAVRG
jgi:hypothetical protein